MFLRRKREEVHARQSSSGSIELPDYITSADNHHDLALLQREFGIKPIQDSDVQAELDLLIADNVESMEYENNMMCPANREGELEDILWQSMREENEDDMAQDALNAADERQYGESHERVDESLESDLDIVEEVTDEDMLDPEFLTQLEAFGHRENGRINKDEQNYQIDLLMQKIKDMKVKSVTLKRQNNIAEALQAFRELKVFEEKLALLKEGAISSVIDVNIAQGKYTATHPPSRHRVKIRDSTCQVNNAPQTNTRRMGESVDDFQNRTTEIVSGVDDEEFKSNDSKGCNKARHVPQIRKEKSLEAYSQERPILDEDIERRLEDAKKKAIRLKRENDIQGAVKVMRQIKDLESRLNLEEYLDRTNSGDKTKHAEIPNVPVVKADCDSDNEYSQLERLLVKFANDAMLQSAKWLPINRFHAAYWRKRYVDDLENLRTRLHKAHTQDPPRFAIQHHSEDVERVLSNVSQDEIRVEIRSLHQLCQLAGKEVFVKFCLNVPSSNPIEGKTSNFHVPATPPYACKSFPSKMYSQFAFPIKRNRGLQRLFDLKKATFEVWRPSTIFRSSQMVARAYLTLSPLNTQCEIHCEIPFVNPNRRPTGGDIEVVIQLRTPLRVKEIRRSTYETLTVENVLAKSSILSSIIPQPAEMQNKGSEVIADVLDDPFDPHSVDLIVSYDVIIEEMKKINENLGDQRAERSDLKDRIDSLSLKKQLLEISMESGRLTLKQYLEQLRSRIDSDYVIFKKLQQQNRFVDAECVMRRIRIMKEEMKVDPNELS